MIKVNIDKQYTFSLNLRDNLEPSVTNDQTRCVTRRKERLLFE